jgi:recombination protein RecT
MKQGADTVRNALERLKPELALALPRHLTPDRLVRVAMTAIRTTPRLLECDRTSLFAAIVTCAQLGLEPDGVLGQAYLVPFKGRVQFIPGYKGLIALARNSGEISSIQAHEVCARDKFAYAYGLNEHLDHVPAEGERGEITHFYAYARFKDGGHIFEVMTRADVETVRNRSEGWQAYQAKRIKSTPWAEHFVQMGRKTLIRRLANYLPLQVQKAVAIESAYERGSHGQIDQYGDLIVDGETGEILEDTTTSKLDALAGGAPKPEPEQQDEATNGGAGAGSDRQQRPAGGPRPAPSDKGGTPASATVAPEWDTGPDGQDIPAELDRRGETREGDAAGPAVADVAEPKAGAQPAAPSRGPAPAAADNESLFGEE